MRGRDQYGTSKNEVKSRFPRSIKTRMKATICRATKKKIVGGSTAKNSSFNLVVTLDIELRFEGLGFTGERRAAALGDDGPRVSRSESVRRYLPAPEAPFEDGVEELARR